MSPNLFCISEWRGGVGWCTASHVEVVARNIVRSWLRETEVRCERARMFKRHWIRKVAMEWQLAHMQRQIAEQEKKVKKVESAGGKLGHWHFR